MISTDIITTLHKYYSAISNIPMFSPKSNPDVDREVLLKLHGKDLFIAATINKYINGLLSDLLWQRKIILEYETKIEPIETFRCKNIYNWLYIRNINDQFLWAIINNFTKLANTFLKRGADIHTENDLALHVATKNGNYESVELILDFYNKKLSEMGLNSCLSFKAGMLNILFPPNKGSDSDSDSDHDSNSAHDSNSDSDSDTQSFKFVMNSNTTYQFKLYATICSALRTSIEKGHINIVKLFLDRGADIIPYDAIFSSAVNGHPEILKLFLDRGIPAAITDGKALILAAKNGHLEVVRILLDNGENVNAKLYDDKFPNALWVAVKNDHREIAKFLIERGSDVTSIPLEFLSRVGL